LFMAQNFRKLEEMAQNSFCLNLKAEISCLR